MSASCTHHAGTPRADSHLCLRDRPFVLTTDTAWAVRVSQRSASTGGHVGNHVKEGEGTSPTVGSEHSHPSQTLSGPERRSHLTSKMPARPGPAADIRSCHRGRASESQEPDSSRWIFELCPFSAHSSQRSGHSKYFLTFKEVQRRRCHGWTRNFLASAA